MFVAEDRLYLDKVPRKHEINHLVLGAPGVFQVLSLTGSAHKGALASKALEDRWRLGFLKARLAEMAQSLVLFQFDLGVT